MTNTLPTDVELLAGFNAKRPDDLARAKSAAHRLIQATTNRERAELVAFLTGRRHHLGLHVSRWVYQLTGLLLQHYPTLAGRALAAAALTALRSRLLVTLNRKVLR